MNSLRQRGLLKLRFESQAPKPTSPCCWSVSAGRPRAARRRPEKGPSRSPSPSRRCRSAGRSTPTTRRTPTSSASTPTMSLTSSRKVRTHRGWHFSAGLEGTLPQGVRTGLSKPPQFLFSC